MTADIMEQLADLVGKSETGEGGAPYELVTSLPNINMAVSGRPDGGFPGGRIITIAGPESSGKTALATELVVAGQKQDGMGFLMDYEHAFHHGHAAGLGLDYKKFYARKPFTGEEGFESTYSVIRTIRGAQLRKTWPTPTKQNPRAHIEAFLDTMRTTDLKKLPPIVGIMDSVASMIPEAQDIRYTDQNMKTKNMEHAMLMSIELKRLARDAEASGTTMILLNQLRTNPGVMFGDNSTEPGGNAPRFYASVMLRLRRVGKWYATYGDKDSEVIGDVVELFTRKNKTYRPFKKTQYVFRTKDPVGLDLVGTMIHLGKEGGALGSKDGTTLTYKGKRYNVDKFDEMCRKDNGLLMEFTDFVMGAVNPVVDGPVIADADEGSAFAGIPLVSPVA